MVKFKELGFDSFDSYVNEFFRTLLPSNKTYSYFVNWRKVKESVKKHITEISLMNSLAKVDPLKRKEHLYTLLHDYPEVVEVIPLLIAERARNQQIDIFDPDTERFLILSFEKRKINKQQIAQIVDFCDRTGITALFDEIKDLHDYLLGIEVGLDTHTRKQRGGKIFERLVSGKIRKLMRDDVMIVENDPHFSLYPIITKGKGKTHDLVIYKSNKPRIIVECNFYNTTGSKPISIAESYIEMFRVAKENGIEFVWITDGPAWQQMKEPLLRSMQKMDWIFNFRLLHLIKKVSDLA